MEEALQFPLFLVISLSALALHHLSRRMWRGNLLAILELLALVVVAVLGLYLDGDIAILLSVIALGTGLAISTFPPIFENASMVARFRGSPNAARVFSFLSLFFFPSLHRRRVHLMNRLVTRVGKGKMSRVDAIDLLQKTLHEPTTTDRVSLYHESVARMFAMADGHEDVARMLPSVLQLIEAGSPSSTIGLAPQMIDSLFKLERPGQALEVMQEWFMAIEARGAALSAGLETQYQRAVVTFLAHCGVKKPVQTALGRSSTLRATFAATHRDRLLTRAGNASLPMEFQGHEHFIEQLAARLTLAAHLPGDFALLRSSLWGARGLILILVGTFIASALTGSTLDPLHLSRLGATSGYLVEQGQWWRLFSHGFLHAGLVHIAFNLFAILLFGNMVERFLGTPSFLTIFLASVVVGGEAARIFGDAPVLVGASGGAFGLFGAAMLCIWYLKEQLPQRWYRRNMGAFLVLAAFNFILGAGVEFVSFSAHAGGFVAGGVLAAGLLLALKRGPAILGSIAWTTTIAGWAFMLVVTIPAIPSSLNANADELFDWSTTELPMPQNSDGVRGRIALELPSFLVMDPAQSMESSHEFSQTVSTPTGSFSVQLVSCRSDLPTGASGLSTAEEEARILANFEPGTIEDLSFFVGHDAVETDFLDLADAGWLVVVDRQEEGRRMLNATRLYEKGLLLIRGNFDADTYRDWRTLISEMITRIALQSCEIAR